MGYGGIFGQKTIVDAFTKEQTLTQATAALFGLGTDAVPDDVLAYVGRYNQHWWRRRVNTSDAGYYEKLTATESKSYLIYAASAVSEYTITYSDMVSVDKQTGGISFTDPKTITVKAQTAEETFNSVLNGKYVKARDINTALYNINIFVPNNAKITLHRDADNNYNLYYDVGIAESVSSEFKESGTVGEWKYLQSSDRSAYPDSGTQDGYEYEYLGIPFDNAVGAPKIETGSYTGTGTYGASNPNSLTFGFVPKIVEIFGQQEATVYGRISGEPGATEFLVNLPEEFTQFRGFLSGTSTQTSYGKKIKNGLSWYNTSSAQTQLNAAGSTYYYIAIC